MRKRFVFKDLDDTVICPIGYPRRKHVDIDVLGQIRHAYDRFHETAGVEVVILSDKPAGQFPTLVHTLVGRAAARYHFAESGATRHDTATYQDEPHERYKGFIATTRKSLVRALQDAGLWRPEPGNKQVCVTIVSDEDWSRGAETGCLFLKRVGTAIDALPAFKQPLNVVRLRFGEDGHIVTMHPSELTKAMGVEWIVETYGLTGVDWERCVFVGDGTSDLDAAREFRKLGVQIACVGNAVNVLKEYVSEQGGFVATGVVEQGYLECMDWYERCVLPGYDNQEVPGSGHLQIVR